MSMVGILKALLKQTIFVTFMASASDMAVPRCLGSIEGQQDKKNDVIYHPSRNQSPAGWIVYFGGDVQDYKENMLAHRDNKQYIKWSLENTATLLHERFPDWEIMIVRPVKVALMTFACYENFMEANRFGAPTHQPTVDALEHLKCLVQNVRDVTGSLKPELPLMLMGFSKGGVVLNQLLYSFAALNDSTNEDLKSFTKNIKTMCWLDGGHSGMSDTWVVDKNVLKIFSALNIQVRIHVTPYQVQCDTRPRIGKEEKIFRETLRRLGVNVHRVLHFENEPRSLENHFRVLENFQETA